MCNDFKEQIETTKTAKFERSCLCSVLTDKQIKDLELKGMMFIMVKEPVRKVEGGAQVVYWSLDETSKHVLSDPKLSRSNICVVTRYEYLKDDEILAYVGEIKGRLPDENQKIILTMILQPDNKNLGEKVDIQSLFQLCDDVKLNINKGNSSNHFQSIGGSFGVGTCRKYFIKENLASFGQFHSEKDRETESVFLENGIIEGMELAGSRLEKYLGYDVLKCNASHLKAIAQKCEMAGFEDDFHIKGETQYASLFYNVDASTMQKHTEFDMNMTTIFVPNQDWKGKEKNHLQFIFHLTGDEKGILSVPMSPGTIIYFHGYLVTHQQIHDNGTCTQDGCCLNYSGYANHAVLCHFLKSFERFLERNSNNSH